MVDRTQCIGPCSDVRHQEASESRIGPLQRVGRQGERKTECTECMLATDTGVPGNVQRLFGPDDGIGTSVG